MRCETRERRAEPDLEPAEAARVTIVRRYVPLALFPIAKGRSSSSEDDIIALKIGMGPLSPGVGGGGRADVE